MTAKRETEVKEMSPLETHNAVSLDFGISAFLVLGRSVSLHRPGQIFFHFPSFLESTVAL